MPRYTKKEFAAKEGITENTLNGWIYKHGLPVVQIGRKTYITQEDFEQWFAGNRKIISEQPEAPNRQEISLPRNLRQQPGILGKLRLAR